MTQQRKQRHHTVPKSHLRRFADDRNQLMRVVLPGTKRHRISINDATVEKDFYTFQRPDGSLSDELESQFGELEGDAADAVRKIVDEERWPIPQQARVAVAAWCALQYLRTPAQRQVGGELVDFAVKTTVALGGKAAVRARIEQQEGRPVTDEEVEASWAAITAFDAYTVVPGSDVHLKAIMNLLEPVTELFHDRGWKLIRFQRKALITSDAPVVLVGEPGVEPVRGIGPATAAGVLVPLDRRVGLFMSRLGYSDAIEQATSNWALEFNLRAVDNAWRAVFHHPDDDPLAGVELPEPRERLTAGDDPATLLPSV